MIKTVIIDDEAGIRSLIRKIVNKYCPELEVVGEAEGVSQAFKLINEVSPDLVFLDIRLGEETGFDLLRKFDQVDFEVIFATAYDQYAINAIKFCALDYLLKPVSIEEIRKAVEKAVEKISAKSQDVRIEQMLYNLSIGNSKKNKIGIPVGNGIDFIEVGDIIRCEANGSYTDFYLQNGDKLLVTGRIKQYEEMLQSCHFLRVHNSHLINLDKIKRYIKGEGGIAVLENGTEVPISRSRKADFLNALK